MFFFLIFHIKGVPIIPSTDAGESSVIIPSMTPAVTPQQTYEREEEYKESDSSAEINPAGTPLFAAFVGLIVVAVIGIIIAIVVYTIKKKKSLQVAATMDDDTEEYSDTAVMTRGFTQSKKSKSSANTTIFAKSIYAVETTIL